MKILYVTDLHGYKWKYEQLLALSESFNVDVLINGGDMLPKRGDLLKQDQFIETFLDTHFKMFEEHGIYYLSCLGNDDLMIFDDQFQQISDKYEHVINLAQKKVEITGYEFIGFNWVVDYPFQLKDRCRMDNERYAFQEQLGPGMISTPEGWEVFDDWFAQAHSLPTIKQELENLVKPNNMDKAVYVIHMPPSGMEMDVCGHGPKVGSKSVYEFIEKNQPLMTLHGHIHESPKMTGVWKGRIGRTHVIQPGQLRELTFVIIKLPEMEFKLHKLGRKGSLL